MTEHTTTITTKFDRERKRFEDFWESTFPFDPLPSVFASDTLGNYTDPQTRNAWLAWHAAKLDAIKQQRTVNPEPFPGKLLPDCS